jgi:hypothetical protein
MRHVDVRIDGSYGLQIIATGVLKMAPETSLQRCPACGRRNDCSVAKGETTCWCFAVPRTLPVPASNTRSRCFCRDCLGRQIKVADSHGGARV